ncbi:MAG: hypothetical protein WDZ46_03655 [Solirubrobacterales bacterium]
MTDIYLILVMSVLIGAVCGMLIRLVYARHSEQLEVQGLPASGGRRAVLRAALIAYMVVVSILLVGVAVMGDVISTMPFVVIALIAGLPLVLLLARAGDKHAS